jgi:glucarate dehydratase
MALTAVARSILAGGAPTVKMKATRAFWGGIRLCVEAAGACETFQQEIAVHSSGELARNNAASRCCTAEPYICRRCAYRHLKDDVITSGKLTYEHGTIAVPTAVPGWV